MAIICDRGANQETMTPCSDLFKDNRWPVSFRSISPTCCAEYLQPALDAGLVEMTIPDKPQSSKQKYRITAAGRALSEQHG